MNDVHDIKRRSFNPADIRMSQDFAVEATGEKQLTTVPVRKPDKQIYVRTHPDEAFRVSVGLIDLQEDKEFYLVDPKLHDVLANELASKILITSITRQGVVFLWPINLPRADGKLDSWSRSAHLAAKRATTVWTRVSANMGLKAYEITTAAADARIPEPEWPPKTFEELLEIAFRDRFIDSLEHPVVMRLTGRA